MNTKPHQHTGGGSPKRTFPPLVVLFTILAFVTTVIGLPFVPTNAATTPAAVTDSTYYAPQDPVKVYAAGFSASSQVTVELSGPGENGSSTPTSTTTKTDGTAGVQFKLSTPWQPGSYKVTVTDGTNKTLTASTSFTVMSAPSAKVEKTSYGPTDRVTLLGTGFAPQSTVDVELSGPGSTTPLNTLTANADGAVGIAVPLSVAAFPAGAYTLKLTDHDHPTLTASTTFSVTAPVPTVSFEKTDYSTKDAVKVYGYNFTPKTEVTITLSGPTGPKTSSMDVTATTDDNGNVGRQFNPPTTDGVSAWEPGAYTVTIASKTTPAATASASFTATAPAPTAATDKENYGTTDRVTIVGTNFTPKGKVTFTLTGPGTTGSTTDLPQPGTANTNGQVAQLLTLNPEIFGAGSYTVTLKDQTNPALTATTNFSVFTPAASTNKTIYGASEALQAFGTGFAPGSTLVFEITGPTGAHSSSSTVEQAADSKGAAGRQFSAPKASEGAAGAWEPGTYTVKISDKANAALTASANITVFAPQAATDKENYGASDRVGIIGTGYAPNSKVTITLTGPGDTGSTTTLPATTNGEGNVAQGVKISDQPWAPGAYTVTITDDTNAALTSTTHFAVLTPTATTDKPNYAVGEKAIITGDKFAPNSAVEFTLTGPGETGATTTLPQDGTANSAGKVAQALTLTKGTFAPGIYTVKLTDKNNASLTASVTLAQNATANADGKVAQLLTLNKDAFTPGTYTVTLTDTANEAITATTTFTVVAPTATTDKPNYAAGQTATLGGEGFAPNTTITYTLSGPGETGATTTLKDASANGEGKVALQLGLKAEAFTPGTYTVTLADKANPAITASTTFNVLAPKAATDEAKYAVGDSVAVSGSGFAPETNLVIELAGPAGERSSSTTVEQKADAQGGLTRLFNAPVTAGAAGAWEPGTYTVTITDKANEAITASVTFTVNAPTASADKPNYAAGENAVLSGEGFAPKSTITFTLSGAGSTTTLNEATANGDGAVALQLGLKAEAFTPGTYTVTLADKANPAITASTTFNVLAPKAATDKDSYAVGDSVKVSGSGFAPESDLVFELSGPAGERSSITTAEQKADKDGALARQFNAPKASADAAGAWEPGTYTVTITDKANEALTASVTFTVVAPTPTPTPTTAAPTTQAPSASASPSESASTQPSTSAPATVAPSSSAPNEAHSGLAQTGATGSTIIGLALLLGLFGTAAVALQRRRGLLH